MIDSISSEIKIKVDDPEILKEVLGEEKRTRSETKIKTKEKELTIAINSKDIVAFKATFNQYIKMIETAINALKVK